MSRDDWRLWELMERTWSVNVSGKIMWQPGTLSLVITDQWQSDIFSHHTNIFRIYNWYISIVNTHNLVCCLVSRNIAGRWIHMKAWACTKNNTYWARICWNDGFYHDNSVNGSQSSITILETSIVVNNHITAHYQVKLEIFSGAFSNKLLKSL